MKILIMDWPAFGGKTVKKVFRDLGHEVFLFDFPQSSANTDANEELGVKIATEILRVNADMVFSFNYFPVVATAVHACRKKYISWVYDNPAVYLYSMTVFFKENYIFHFDSYEVERMRKDGVEHVYYLPLAANTEAYDEMIPDEEMTRKYGADVVMIGSLYKDKFAYFNKYTDFDEHTKGYLDALITAQEMIAGVNFLEEALTLEIMKKILEKVPLADNTGTGYDTAAWNFANYYLAMAVTAREREDMLKSMAERYSVALYSTDRDFVLPGLKNRGTLDYYKEAPFAIKCAKINLNVSLKSIRTGISLRVMDIMACGGFVLSNYQEDLCREFVPGDDFVYYESIEDAVEKAGYYLKHEDERLEIAGNGYRKVKELHRFEDKCVQMIDMII